MNNEQKITLIQLILGVDADGKIGPKTKLAFEALTDPVTAKGGIGKGSWYSQYEGRYTWVDKGDGKWNKDKTIYLGPNNALGVPDDQQGVALYDHGTLGDWFLVTAPNGLTLKLRQTDIGPHPSTGRKIDIAAVAAEAFGYSPHTFPTDGIFRWEPAA